MTAWYNENDPKAAAWLRVISTRVHPVSSSCDQGGDGMSGIVPMSFQANADSRLPSLPRFFHGLAYGQPPSRGIHRKPRTFLGLLGLIGKSGRLRYQATSSFSSLRDRSLPSLGVACKTHEPTSHSMIGGIQQNKSIYSLAPTKVEYASRILDRRVRPTRCHHHAFSGNVLCISENSISHGNERASSPCRTRCIYGSFNTSISYGSL